MSQAFSSSAALILTGDTCSQDKKSSQRRTAEWLVRKDSFLNLHLELRFGQSNYIEFSFIFLVISGFLSDQTKNGMKKGYNFGGALHGNDIKLFNNI
jgi:hypothetical protein